jgi:hypothetical protein
LSFTIYLRRGYQYFFFITSFRNSSSSFDADNLTCGTTSSLAASIESLLNFAYSSSPLSTFEWIVYRHHFLAMVNESDFKANTVASLLILTKNILE